MQSEAEAISQMSETLTGANFTRNQSDAFIGSMALAIKTFAVTPQVLDDRLDRLRQEWKHDFKVHKDELNRLLDGHRQDTNLRIEDHRNDTNRRLDGIQELQRSLLRYFIGFTLVMLAGLMGALAAVLVT